MYENWEDLDETCKKCEKCKLYKTRTNVVIGCGNRNADLMFIGEGPGADEDLTRYSFCWKGWKTFESSL